MKRYLVIATCWCIVAPLVPVGLVWGIAERVARLCEWSSVNRKWSRWLISKAEHLAARHGVDL